MGYIGNQQTQGFSQVPAKQDLTGATGTSLTLSHAVASAEGISIFINNVRQEPTTAYSIGADGVTVTLTGSVVATDDIYVVYNSLALQTTVPPDASVSTAKIIDGSVTKAKIGTTELDLATIKDSTGTTTAMTIDSTGRVLQPAKPFFHVSESTNTGPVGITNQLAFDTVITNIGSHYDTAGFFKAPVAGVYQFDFSGLGCGNTSGEALPSNQSANALLQKATDDAFTTGLVTFASGFSQVVSSTSFPNISVSGSILLAANDRVRAVMANNYVYASSNAIYDPQFSGYLVG